MKTGAEKPKKPVTLARLVGAFELWISDAVDGGWSTAAKDMNASESADMLMGYLNKIP